MPRSTERLGVWLGGLHVADLEQRRWPEIRLRYTDAALETWRRNSPIVSCSLPLAPRPQDALAFCKGLLPEGQALQTLAARAGVATNDTLRLLARYGRDVAGALVIGDDPADPSRFSLEPYTAASLATAVEELDEYPLGAHDDSELSLAGLQDKLLLVRANDGGWARPLHGLPSTHILKRDDLRHPGLVVAEAACLALARALALTTIDAAVEQIGDATCLIVSRFDRHEEDGATVRIHQEDLCQATGRDPEAARGRGKYERAGGPGFADAARLLDLHATDPTAELERLLAVVTFTALIGNADAHGKNLALLYDAAEHVTLAPLYDTVPTRLWPKLRTEAAMTIGGTRSLPDVTADDIVREARSWPLAEARARRVVEATRERLEAALHTTGPPDELAAAISGRIESLRRA